MRMFLRQAPIGTRLLLAMVAGGLLPVVLFLVLFQMVIKLTLTQREYSHMHALTEEVAREVVYFLESEHGVSGKDQAVLPDGLSGLLRRAKPSGGGLFVLMDREGRVIAHPEESLVGTAFDGFQPGDQWFTTVQGLHDGPDGRRHFYVTALIGPRATGADRMWVLVGLVPEEEMLPFLREGQWLLLGIAALTLAVTGLVGLFISRRLSRSVVTAARAAQKVSMGDLDALVPEKGPREMRMMAAAFNRMVQELRDHRGRLEGLVLERTHGLRDSQRRLEQITAYLQAAYESITDGILVGEWPTGRVVAANRRFMSFFGLEPADLRDKTCHDIAQAIRPCFTEPPEDPFHGDLCRDQPERTASEEWQLARPKPLTLSVYTAPVRGGSGPVLARLWMFRDLTQQRMLEEELRQAQKMEAIGRLAGGIAHDFNNLLTGILGNLSMVEMEIASGGNPSSYVAAARQAGRAAADLVSQLLSFSRRGRLQLRRCGINRVLREVHELLRHSVDPRVELRLELADDAWDVAADATQLQQVLMNLCVNGVDAMPNGGRLTLRTGNVRVDHDEAAQWMDARAGDYVRVAVEDKGVGMTQEVQTHLFEPFFTTKEPGKGTGLGLAMSYGIVKQHGGWITCYSELNRGTTFGIYLPRTHMEGEEPVAVGRPAPVRGGKEKILVVDDEAAVRGVIQSILHRYGYATTVAASGEEALLVLEKNPAGADLVLLDLTMPRLSGRETYKRLRARHPKLPVVLSSGYPIEMPAFEEEVGSRPEGFVQKPYEAIALARIVREVLDAAAKKA